MKQLYTVLVTALVLASFSCFAQESTNTVEDTTKLVLPDFIVTPDTTPAPHDKNDVRIGFYITRVTFAYDRASHDHQSSIGIETQVHLGYFPGAVAGIVGRYYFKQFDRTGFFLEEKLSYGFYKIPVDSTLNNQSYKYYCSTTSVGFRLFGKKSKGLFVEFLGGLRLGSLYGNTNYTMSVTSNDLLKASDNTVAKEFNTIGPGYPWYFNIRIGATF